MNPEVLDKILSCKALPSLPAVALKVIEQTSDPNIKLTELATTIQNDQGLTAKVLKTVNSSFYGLRSPCATINRALVLMGLAPVKTLVLGFSLVNSVNDRRATTSFDYVAYWRRGLYSAVASKAIAEAAGKKWADEAFLAGLLQDIGVIAMLSALGDDYMRVIEAAGDHRGFSRAEVEAFEITHPEIGAMLAQRWKLPKDLVMPVRYHDRPTAAPSEYSEICRCVGLANIVHDILTDAEPLAEVAKLYERGEQWFRFAPQDLDAIVRRTADGTRELARLFNLDTGKFANADAILDTALERQVELDQVVAPVQSAGDSLASLVKDSSSFDPMTGAHARSSFTSLVRAAISAPSTPGKCATLVHVGIDTPSKPEKDLPDDDVDDRVVRVASVLSRHFAAAGMTVCRLSNDLFAVVLVAADERSVLESIELVRCELATIRPVVTVSMGVARFGAGVTSPQELVVAATRSLQAARKNGGNAVNRGTLAA